MYKRQILLGALSTVAGLFLTGRLPRIGKPEALYHPSFSSNRFGVFAHVPPEGYDSVRDIMNEAGPEEVLVDEA